MMQMATWAKMNYSAGVILRFPHLVHTSVFLTLLLPGLAVADWYDDLGHTQLKVELGAATPDGAGVQVTQVEGNESAGLSYLPVAMASSPFSPASGDLAGVTLAALSGTGAGSSHAAEVAAWYYGRTTHASLARGVTSVRCFEANDWTGDGMIWPGPTVPTYTVPLNETSAVQNHSWISLIDASTSAAIVSDVTEIVRRLDYSVANDDYLCVCGMNNNSANPIPALVGTAYNVLSVGRTDGFHSTGTTSPRLDGPGRQKPEIVAPGTKVSWATPMVASCGVLLTQTAKSQPALLPAAQNTEVLKAILMAGATKTRIPGWSHTTALPLDAHYGAGEVNILNSHHILTSGEQNSSPAALVARTGWDFGNFTAAGTRSWTFTVPAGTRAAEFSAVLTWYATVSDTPGPGFTPAYDTLPNLSLRLFQSSGFVTGTELWASDSAIDNVEHVWLTGLPAGEYTLRVQSDRATDFALAWRADVVPLDAQVAMAATSNATQLDFAFQGLPVGTFCQLQQSTDLASWATVYPFTPAAAAATWSMPRPSGPRYFYRLKWWVP